MLKILHGNAIEYEILDCVAEGQESIVYKAQVKSTKRCVALKFKRKNNIVKFRYKELPVFQTLDHLNIIKILDYVEDIGSLELNDEIDGKKHCINKMDYFCVVEDFVTGEALEGNISSSLYNYCRQRAPRREALYKEVIKFQEEFIFKWIFEFCDIMLHMTKENRILHLDIKPENIMVTRTGSIVLIDMGLADFIEEQSAGLNLQYDLKRINKTTDNIERRYCNINDEIKLCFVYGTPGFAAPECYYKDGEGWEQDFNLKNPFISGRATDKDGIVDVRSDIFSFGCVLWDIVHLGGYGKDAKKKDYATINKNETRDGYFRRDLHYASPYYLKEFEDIILKCTEEKPENRFQNYEELREAAEKAKRKLPRSEENSKKIKILRHVAVLFFMMLILMGTIWNKGLNLEYEIALEDFQTAVNNYSENTNPIDFRDDSLLVLSEAIEANKKTDSIYKDILNAVTNNNKITSIEFSEILYKCLGEKDTSDNITLMYINSAMKNPGEGNDITTVSKFIESNYQAANCEGYFIASAIANCKKDSISSFEILIKYQDLSEYRSSLNYLARILLTEEKISNNLEYREVVTDIREKTEE